jgi:hypothetical protein
MMKRAAIIGGIVLMGAIAAACVVMHSTLTQVGDHDVFAGELHNYTNTDILGHDIEIEFTDANGNLVDNWVVSGCLRSLQRGTSDFFEVTSDQPAASTSGATARLSYNNHFRVGPVVTGNLAISNVVAKRSATDLTVTGTLTNINPATLTDAKACVVVRSDDNDVVRVGGIGVGDLVRNDSGDFSVKITVPDSATSVDHVDVYADGFQNGTPIAPSSVTNRVPQLLTPTATSTPTVTGTPPTATNTPVPTDTPTATATPTTT